MNEYAYPCGCLEARLDEGSPSPASSASTALSTLPAPKTPPADWYLVLLLLLSAWRLNNITSRESSQRTYCAVARAETALGIPGQHAPHKEVEGVLYLHLALGRH